MNLSQNRIYIFLYGGVRADCVEFLNVLIYGLNTIVKVQIKVSFRLTSFLSLIAPEMVKLELSYILLKIRAVIILLILKIEPNNHTKKISAIG